MSRTCINIRTLQVAALAGVCMLGTAAIAQTKGKATGVTAKLRPVATHIPVQGSEEKHMARVENPGVDPVISGSGGTTFDPRGTGGACVIPGGGGCTLVGSADECTNMGGVYQGDGTGCPVQDCTISSSSCQNFEYPRVGGTSLASMGPGHTTLLMVADDFLTDGAANHDVTEACWWGTYTGATTINCDNPAPDVDHFYLRIFAMTGGLPDINTVVGSAEQGVDMTVTRRAFCDTGADGVHRITYEYHATLANAISLGASSCYALEIRNPNNNTVNWFWSHSSDVANNQCWQRNGDVAYSSAGSVAGDRAFCMNVGLNIFQATCAMPPPPICTNPDTNGQPLDPSVGYGGFSASPSSGAVGLQLAERFQFTQGGNITNVCFQGFWIAQDGSYPTGPDAPDFDITYFTNDNGQPGSVIAQYHVGDTGVSVFRNGGAYRIEHPPVAVQAHTCYFFSISRLTDYADPAHNIRFAWDLTTPGSVGDNLAHSRTAGGAAPGPWSNISFVPPSTGGDLHFLFDEGSVETPDCPATQGACCVGSTCTVTDEAGCTAMGGVFQGVGVQCGGSTCAVPPANDNCSAATVISGTGDFPYDNRGATCEAGERPMTCGPSSNSIWFNWSPTCDGSYTIGNCAGSVDDTIIAAYDGTDCANSTELACGDDTCGVGGGPSVVTINATAGSHYLIRIASWTGTDCAGADGNTGTLNVSRDGGDCPQSCPCDFNNSGTLNSQDFFDFLNCFFTAGCPNADYNHSGTVNSQDFFDFLNCFFQPPSGC